MSRTKMLGYLVASIVIGVANAHSFDTDIIKTPVEPATAAKNIGDWHSPQGCPGGPVWVETEQIFTDPQCPNIGNIPGLSIADCKTKCDATPDCSAINVADAGNYCVLRACPLPVPSPLGTPAQSTGWKSYHKDWSTSQYMRGFQQKIEHGCHGGGECTGLNSIRILCGTRSDATYQSGVSDYNGLDGDWGKEFICPKGTFVNQFQLYSQKYQGMWSDDMGAGAISARCEGQSEGTEFLSAGFEAQGARSGTGYWSEFVGCPSGSVGCGISTSGKTSFPDNTEITNTAYYCCTAPPTGTNRQLEGGSFMERSWEDLAESVVDAGAVKAGRELWNKLSDEEKEALKQLIE